MKPFFANAERTATQNKMGLDFKKLGLKISASIERNTQYIEPRVFIISIIASIGFPLYYVIWHYIFPQPYENLWLRLLGSALFIPSIFVKHWPQWVRRYKSIYWYISTLYALPFFFTFMLLHNNASTVWLLSTLIALFLMVILLDWINILVQLTLGVTLAWIAYLASREVTYATLSIVQYIPVYLFAVIVGIAANYSSEMINQERLRAMLATASTIAHELRTPLLGIRSGAAGLRQYLPALLEAYKLAHQHGLPIAHVRLAHLHSMHRVLERIESEADHSNTIIDMLLMNTRITGFTPDGVSTCSMAQCIETALNRYPFASEKERQLVFWNNETDFSFRGIELLTVHVMFNLMKNALYHIAKAGKGQIFIRLIHTPLGNMLIFRDTGAGVPPEVLPHIFNRFYSWSPDNGNRLGAGIGLAFCQSVMSAFGGSIHCESQLGEYTEFTLTFPCQPTSEEAL